MQRARVLPRIFTMKILALNCNQCGAPLEVPARAKFVTCNFCSARLSVQRTDEVTYTEAIEEIQERTREMAEDLEDLKAQGELERLDRDWVEKRGSLMTRGKDGSMSVPGKGATIVVGVIVMCFGAFWTLTASSIGAPSFFPLFGLVFIGAALFGMVATLSKADAFEKAQREYQAERKKLLARNSGGAVDEGEAPSDSEDG